MMFNNVKLYKNMQKKRKNNIKLMKFHKIVFMLIVKVHA